MTLISQMNADKTLQSGRAHRRTGVRYRHLRAILLLTLLATLVACDGRPAVLDVGGSLPAPANRTPLPTVAPVVPTPAPVVPTPRVSPPAPPVAPTPGNGSAPSPTRPAPTLVAPALPTAAGHLPRDIGYDGGTWAVLFSPGARGNHDNGQFIIDKLIGYIDAAESSIDLAVFETNLTPVAEALIRAHERGVAVRWITDDENGRDADGEEGRGQFARLEAAGIEVRDDLRSAFMHNKFILIDGRILWTGSMNLTTNDVFRNNNNVVVLQWPAAVAVYAREFEEMWNGQFGPRSPSNVNGQTVMTAAGLPITCLLYTSRCV